MRGVFGELSASIPPWPARPPARRKAVMDRNPFEPLPTDTAWLPSIEQAMLRSALQRLAPTSFGAQSVDSVAEKTSVYRSR